MITMKEVGENLKRIREEKNISVYQVEKETKIKHENIYRWEKGKIEPSIMNCIKLAEFYNVTLDEMIFFK